MCYTTRLTTGILLAHTGRNEYTVSYVSTVQRRVARAREATATVHRDCGRFEMVVYVYTG
jgi:hypothetical protein